MLQGHTFPDAYGATTAADRKRTEERLREQAALLDMTLDAILVRGTDGRISFWNRGAEEMYGWTSPESVGAVSHDLFRTRFPAPREEIEASLLRDGRWEGELVHERRDGRRMVVASRWALKRDAGGRAAAVMEINRDVTERRTAERELQKSEERFRSLIENATDIIAILDADGTIRYESPALERVLGFQVHEMVGTNAFDSIHPDDRGAVLESFAHVLEAPERVVTVEYRFRCRDGSWRVLESNGQNLLDNPAVSGIVVNSRDVTERRVAEEALAAQARELRRSNQELEQFAYVASHDLQEPLRKIQAFGDRLQSRYAAALGEQGTDYVARMQNAAGRMQRLIQDLLGFSRVTSKAAPFVPVALAGTAREVLSDLQVRLQATGGRVEVGDLPVVEGDATQLRQLLQNLIGNSLKFHREGVPPVVRIESAAPGADGQGGAHAVEVRVADNGIGFEEKYLDRIFDPFQRLHGRMEYEGTGMGLAICRKIVERHGGEITARSRPGEGSTFIITLPAPATGEEP